MVGTPWPESALVRTRLNAFRRRGARLNIVCRIEVAHASEIILASALVIANTRADEIGLEKLTKLGRLKILQRRRTGAKPEQKRRGKSELENSVPFI